MSDRGIFVVSFLIVVLIVAGAFALPQFFFFELFKSLIYVLIAVMVFFGDNKYSYMLGIVTPPLWFVLSIVLGGFFADLELLLSYLRGESIPLTDTPLHGLALLAQILLVILCARSWRKEVPGPFFGKAFGICLAVSVVYVGILAGWYAYGIAGGA